MSFYSYKNSGSTHCPCNLSGNEVFSGGAEYADETDLYLKALAQIQNGIAARADHVCRVVCGIPVYYKGGDKV